MTKKTLMTHHTSPMTTGQRWFRNKKSQTDSLPQSKLCLAEKHAKFVIKIMIPKEFITDRLYPSTPQPTVTKFVFCSFSREFIWTYHLPLLLGIFETGVAFSKRVIFWYLAASYWGGCRSCRSVPKGIRKKKPVGRVDTFSDRVASSQLPGCWEVINRTWGTRR